MRSRVRLVGMTVGAVLAAAPLAAAHGDGCVDSGKLADRFGACTWDDGRCASGYADATPRVMDDTYGVWACVGGEGGTYACYSHARTSTCLPPR